MNDPTPVRQRRKAINVSLDPQLVKEARELGINVSRACEEGLADATGTARRQRWVAENREAMEDWNRWIGANGLPLEHIRAF